MLGRFFCFLLLASILFGAFLGCMTLMTVSEKAEGVTTTLGFANATSFQLALTSVLSLAFIGLPLLLGVCAFAGKREGTLEETYAKLHRTSLRQVETTIEYDGVRYDEAVFPHEDTRAETVLEG